jgi:hypothetical protein
VSLPFALVAMMVGALLLTPVLDYLSSRFLQVREYEQVLGARYSDDAAIEYAIWKLGADAAFRAALLARRGTPITLVDLPEPVNGVTAQVEVVLVNPRPWPWALWAAYLVDIQGNNTGINGGIHSNGTVRIGGNNTAVTGTVSYTGAFEGNTALFNPQWAAAQPNPLNWTIEQFRPGGSEALKAAAAGKYHNVALNGLGGTWIQDSKSPYAWGPVAQTSGTLPPGLYYINGKVKLDINKLSGANVTIVAEQWIEIDGNKNDFALMTPYVPALLFFSNLTNPTALDNNHPAILITGNKFLGDGIMYAPNGIIQIDKNNVKLKGVLVAHTVLVTKQDLGLDPDLNNLTLPETCSVYDIRSTARGREAVARVRFCLESTIPSVDAWAFQ